MASLMNSFASRSADMQGPTSEKHRDAIDPQARVHADASHAADAFPSLLVEAEKLARAVSAGVHGRRRAGDGETFWQHRPYGFGDPVSSIDWRQSARAADRLYVRQNEWEAAAAVWLWRDGSASLDFASRPQLPSKRHRADVLSVALSILLSEASERIGVLGRQTIPYQGRRAPTRILETLHANLDPGDYPALTDIRAGSRVILLSDFFLDLDRIAEAVAHFATLGVDGVLVQVLDEAEETFPFGGRTEFEDVETSARLTFGDAGALAADYKNTLAAYQQELRAIAGRAGWTMITHRNDQPATHALIALYAALSDHKSAGVMPPARTSDG